MSSIRANSMTRLVLLYEFLHVVEAAKPAAQKPHQQNAFVLVIEKDKNGAEQLVDIEKINEEELVEAMEDAEKEIEKEIGAGSFFEKATWNQLGRLQLYFYFWFFYCDQLFSVVDNKEELLMNRPLKIELAITTYAWT